MTNTDKNISKQNQKELLESLESWFSDCVSFDKEWKDKAKDMYARYHGTQWTSDEISELKDRKQAVTTFNHISPAIDSIIGGERQNRPKIKMAGRTLDDEQVAEVKTNLYDYIQYNSNTDDELDMVIKDCLVAGRGTMYIEPSIDKDEKADIRHSWIDYRDMFIDPLSKRDDLRDCRHLHFALFVDEDIVDKNFRKYNPDEDGHGEIYSFETSSEDELWFEKGNRKRPRLITSWYMDEKGDISKPDGITKLQDGALAEGRVQILPTAQLADSHIKLMQIAEQKLLSSAGINPAYVGQSGQYESAKKSQINISQASNTLVPFLNKLRIFRWELADKTMKLVPEFFTDEQLVRILNPDGSYAFMPVNEVVILDDGTLTKVNDITVDDVDIIIEDAPKGLNEKEEQFMQLMQIQGQTSRPIPMEILLRYSSLKDKYSLAGELEQYYGMEAQLQQAQQQMEAMAKQIQDLGGVIDQQQNNIVQINTARQVEKEVNKKKEKLNKELGL
jgi:hypothetical protein